MRKSYVLAFMLIFIILSMPGIFAYTYLNIYIDSSGKAEFFGETNETRILRLPLGISVQDGEIRGTTQELTQKNGEIWTFYYSLTNAELKVILPDGTTVQNISNGEIFIERGRISVYFQDSLSVNYVINDIDEGPDFLIWLVILTVTGVIITYFYRQRIIGLFKPKIIYKKQRHKKDHIDLIKHVLNDREKLILGNLREVGKVKMSHLRKLCDIPKASFSRHIQELEKKKLVVRTGEGKNKFLELVTKI